MSLSISNWNPNYQGRDGNNGGNEIEGELNWGSDSRMRSRAAAGRSEVLITFWTASQMLIFYFYFFVLSIIS